MGRLTGVSTDSFPRPARRRGPLHRCAGRPVKRGRGLILTLAAALSVACAVVGAAAPPETLRAVQVFVALEQRAQGAAQAEYLKSNAGGLVEGAGHLEAVFPRTYFDTSVPHTNPVVALIQVGSGRKVVCGLLRPLTAEETARLPEGSDVAFRGKLADAHDWGEWQTLYLSDCAVHAR